MDPSFQTGHSHVSSLTSQASRDIGLSAGRNRLLDVGDTPIVVFADDDHLITDQTRLPDLMQKLNARHDLDLLAALSNHQERPKLMKADGKRLRIPHGHYRRQGSIRWCRERREA